MSIPIRRLWALALLLPGVACHPELEGKSFALALSAAFPVASGATQQSTSDLVIRRVWEGVEPDFWSAHPSPDGRFITETDWTTGDLAVIDLQSGRLERLTDKGSWVDLSEWAETSVFSPDGQKVAYTWWHEDDEGYEIRMMNVDGSEMRVVLESPGSQFYAMLEDWSADGEQLLTLLWPDEERFQVALVSARDGEIQVLREWSETPLFVSCDLSPDGRYVACDLARENVPEERDIFVLPVGGGDPVPVVEGAGEDQLMGWAPDGRSLFFHSDRGLTEGIWMVPVTDGRASGDPVLLRGDVWRMEPIGFSRDAFFFGVTTQRLQVHTALVDLTGNRIVSPPFPVEDPSGAGGPLRTSSFGAWSGDGRYLAYFRFPRMFTYNPKLVIRSVSGDETRTIDVPLARVAGNRGWSADGNGILVNGVAPGDDRVGIFRIDLRSGTTRAIVYREDLEDAVSWTAVLSPDGRTLFYARRPEGSESGSWTSSMPFPVVARDLASGTERVIAVVTGLMSLVISPDGGTLAMQTFDRATRTFGIAVLPASGGEPRELHRAEDQMVGFTWTPDGRHLLGGTLAEGTSKLWKFDVRDGTTTPLAGTLEPGILGGLASLQIHPDGRHLTFESGEGRGEIWIVENLPGTGEAPYSP